ncbi:MAG: putative lipid II flippase FtsW [Clostridia bacterium]|nr:putative lipid II flippase FtsW [Clostridia bacterium]
MAEFFNGRFLSYDKKKDGALAVVVILLALFGVVAVYSASNYNAAADFGSPYYFAAKQALGVAIGLIAMFITAHIDYHRYFKLALPLIVVGLVFLALVFVPGLSVEVYGAKRWIDLKLFTVQPSEMAKFFLVVFIAAYFAEKPERARGFLSLLPVLAVGGATCLLIIIEPNMSVTVCVGAVTVVMIFAAGVKLKVLAAIGAPVVAAVPLLIIAEPYRLKRLSAFLDPWESPQGEGYQLLQSLYGLASGGLFGVGLFNSRQKFRFLPFSESDFILSVIGEEIGFFGTAILFAAMFFVIMRGFKAAFSARDYFGYLLAVGITSVYAVQVMINTLVVTGSIPPTGLPLPLVSAGNTSIIIFMAAFGVLINVSGGGSDDGLSLRKKPTLKTLD